MAVSGLTGTLSQDEVRGALEPRLPRFLRCATARLAELEVLSGSMTFAFHVAVNGSVAAVSPSQSSLGDRATERCMLQVAEGTRFPPPHGGEADFTWPLELPLADDVRAPVELTADFAQPALSARVGGVEQAEAAQACGGGSYVVTAYLDPDGRVVAAGVATPDPATPADLDCVSKAIAGWSFPSPGSYLGKVSFTLP
ncbi:MAG: hypothetical protein JWN48_2011 [Myxococcaceae bacterium]|nr:hypothetical protein [Myxococcaceae bacterium]